MEVKLYSLVNGAHLQKALFWSWFQIHVKFHSKTHTPVNFCFNFCLKCWLLKLFFCTSRKDLTKVSCKINTSAIMLFQKHLHVLWMCLKDVIRRVRMERSKGRLNGNHVLCIFICLRVSPNTEWFLCIPSMKWYLLACYMLSLHVIRNLNNLEYFSFLMAHQKILLYICWYSSMHNSCFIHST